MSINKTLMNRHPHIVTNPYRFRIPTPSAFILISCFSLGLAASAQAEVVFQKLVAQGQERPDKAEPDSADTFYEVACAVIEGDDIVFRSLNDGFRTGFDSIWTIKAGSSTLRKIIGKKQFVPGGVGKFSAFGFNNGGDYSTSPLLHNGRVVFFANDSNPDVNLRAVGGLYSLRLQGGSIRRIANYNTINPSAGGTLFGQFTGSSQQACHNAYAFNGSKVFFSAATLGNNNPAGVYQAKFDGTGLSKVRDNNDPDTSFAFFQPANFYGPTLGFNSKNKELLLGYTGANVFGPQALYLGNQHLLLRADSLPGDPSPTARGSNFNYFLLDGHKSVFFAIAGEDYFGIFTKRNISGLISKIVNNLDSLPGISQCPINNIGNFVADAGRVLFFASSTNCDGMTVNGRTAIFMAYQSKITRIIGFGDDLGDGSTAVEIFNELGPGSVQGKRLVFSVRTTTSNRTLYVANLP